MKLTVGILRKDPAWILILRQIGIPFEIVAIDSDFNIDDFGVIIVNATSTVFVANRIKQYVNEGGAVLVEAEHATSFPDFSAERVYIKYFYSKTESFFSIPVFGDLERWCLVPSGARYLQNQKGTKLIAIKHVGRGTVMILPSGLVSGVLDTQIKRRQFYSHFSKRQPSERVAKISKRAIRQVIEECLKFLFHSRELPFIHLWYFPDGADCLFSFRVDTDFSSIDEVEQLYRLCRENEVSATWFVETHSPQDWIDFYGRMENQEIGLHCYRHRVFRNYRSNLKNIQKGMLELESHGIHTKGFAAPYGEWHAEMGQAVEDSGFAYSSEFGLSYDDLPFYPYLNDRFSSVLQIPIHPISMGRLVWACYSLEDAFRYYLAQLDRSQTLQIPLIVYHHPGHGRLDVFRKLFQEAAKRKVPSIALGDYAIWWKKRTSIEWCVDIKHNVPVFHSSCSESRFWLRACLLSGETLFHPFPGNSKWKAWQSRDVRKTESIHFDPRNLRKLSWQSLKCDLLHYFGKMRQ